MSHSNNIPSNLLAMLEDGNGSRNMWYIHTHAHTPTHTYERKRKCVCITYLISNVHNYHAWPILLLHFTEEETKDPSD